MSLQGVDASGNPDGVIKGGGTPVSKTFTPSGSGTFQKIQFDNFYSVARGEMLALVMDYSSGTIDTSNFASMSSRMVTSLTDFPYAITNDAGSRSRVGQIPCFGVASGSTVYGFPVENAAVQIINSGAVAEAGAKFTLPSGWASTYRVVGAKIWMGTLIAAKALTLTLYDGGGAGDTTPLQSVAWDSDRTAAVTGADTSIIYFDESALSTLTFGNTYRIALSTADASNQTIQGFSVAAAADMEAFQMGQNFTLSTRTGGNWTDTATSRLFMEIILADLTKPTFSGGGGGHIIGG